MTCYFYSRPVGLMSRNSQPLFFLLLFFFLQQLAFLVVLPLCCVCTLPLCCVWTLQHLSASCIASAVCTQHFPPISLGPMQYGPYLGKAKGLLSIKNLVFFLFLLTRVGPWTSIMVQGRYQPSSTGEWTLWRRELVALWRSYEIILLFYSYVYLFYPTSPSTVVLEYQCSYNSDFTLVPIASSPWVGSCCDSTLSPC